MEPTPTARSLEDDARAVRDAPLAPEVRRRHLLDVVVAWLAGGTTIAGGGWVLPLVASALVSEALAGLDAGPLVALAVLVTTSVAGHVVGARLHRRLLARAHARALRGRRVAGARVRGWLYPSDVEQAARALAAERALLPPAVQGRHAVAVVGARVAGTAAFCVGFVAGMIASAFAGAAVAAGLGETAGVVAAVLGVVGGTAAAGTAGVQVARRLLVAAHGHALRAAAAPARLGSAGASTTSAAAPTLSRFSKR